MRNNISHMTSAGDEDLKLALEALTASIPIITSSKVANAKAGEYIIAHLDCGCRFSVEQRQLTKSRTTLLECVLSLGQLIEVKHAKCIADRAVSNAAAAAVAAQKESLTGTFFGTMMNASAAQATSERRAAELLAARELVKSSKQAATVAEQRAEAARRAEVEAAEPFRAPRIAAESEAAKLAAEWLLLAVRSPSWRAKLSGRAASRRKPSPPSPRSQYASGGSVPTARRRSGQRCAALSPSPRVPSRWR